MRTAAHCIELSRSRYAHNTEPMAFQLTDIDLTALAPIKLLHLHAQ